MYDYSNNKDKRRSNQSFSILNSKQTIVFVGAVCLVFIVFYQWIFSPSSIGLNGGEARKWCSAVDVAKRRCACTRQHYDSAPMETICRSSTTNQHLVLLDDVNACPIADHFANKSTFACSLLKQDCTPTFDEYVENLFPRKSINNNQKEALKQLKALAYDYFHPDLGDFRQTLDRFVIDGKYFDSTYVNDIKLLLESAGKWFVSTHYDIAWSDRLPIVQSQIDNANFKLLENDIIKDQLKTARTVYDRNPKLTLIGGGAGAGKSSSIMYLYEQGLIAATDSAPGVVYINHDQIIQQHPLFEELKSQGEYNAAGLLHTDAQRVGALIFEKALKLRTDIIYEGTMASFQLTMQKIKAGRRNGYDVNMIGTTVGVGIALRRCLMRALVTKRYVAPRFVKRQHRDFARYWQRYCSAVDRCWLYHASHGQVRLVAETRGTALDVADVDSPDALPPANVSVLLPDLFDSFVAVKFLNINAKNVFELYNDVNFPNRHNNKYDNGDDDDDVDVDDDYVIENDSKLFEIRRNNVNDNANLGDDEGDDDAAAVVVMSDERPRAATSWDEVIARIQRSARLALLGDGRCAATRAGVRHYARVLARFLSLAQDSTQDNAVCVCFLADNVAVVDEASGDD